MLTEKQKKLSKKDYNRAYYEKNKEKIAKRDKDYYEKNKEKIAKRNKDYKEKNKDKIKAYLKAYHEKKRQHQIQHPDEYLNVFGTKVFTNGVTEELKKQLPRLINKKIKEMVKNV